MTPPQYHAMDEAKIREAQQSRVSAPYEKELISSDGKCVPVVVQTAQVEDGSGHFAVLMMDATALVQTEQDFQKLAGGLLNLYDEERRRIARELHDTTAQNLAALSMNLTMLGSAMTDTGRAPALLKECEALTEECLKEVRSLSYMLHPPLLDELGLETALRAFISLYERRTGVAVDLILRGQGGRLAPEVELAAFRIAQEGLFNVQRHSGSKQAEVRLSHRDGSFEVAVRDWGKGVEPHLNLGGGVGIAGMRERVRLLGGQLEIGPVDPGTVVRAKFPMEQ
jgi:two-component system NarL family sensor kinase